LKKLNKPSQKAFAAMKQKLLKHNKEFEKEIANYIQNPLGSDEEEEEKAPVSKKKKKRMRMTNLMTKPSNKKRIRTAVTLTST